MQYIDVNCMIGEWGFSDLHFKSAQELLEEMERLGISKSLVFNSRSWLYAPAAGNEAIVNELEGYPNLLPVMALTPLIDQEFGGKDAIYDFIKRNNIAAVRLFPFDQNFTLNVWNVEKLFSILDEICMPVLIESRGIYGGIDPHYSSIYEIASNFSNTPIILLNVGYRSLRILYELFSRCENIYADTSTFIAYRGIEDAVTNFGSGKLVFGTRMPFMEGGVSLGRLIYSDISSEDKENIASGNITRILNSNKLLHQQLKEGV